MATMPDHVFDFLPGSDSDLLQARRALTDDDLFLRSPLDKNGAIDSCEVGPLFVPFLGNDGGHIRNLVSGGLQNLLAHNLRREAERGSAWTLQYPAYSVVVPGPNPIRVPLAYPIGRRDERFASFVNTWIALKGKDGTLDAAYKHWILGQDAAPRQPRWSIVRNVLHWVE